MKKYSSAEQNIVLQWQLYTIDQHYGYEYDLLKSVSDLLPGVILINDMQTLENVYMSKTGCTYLHKTAEELKQMGPAYFKNEVFCADEIAWIINYFGALVTRNDFKETTGFYQKVRPNIQTDWSRFYLSGKLMQNQPNRCIYMGIPVNHPGNTINKINYTLGIETPSPVAYQRFSLLTKREKEVLGMITKGYTNQQISDRLFIAQYTVKTHRKNINSKLGTKSLTDMIRIADSFNL